VIKQYSRKLLSLNLPPIKPKLSAINVRFQVLTTASMKFRIFLWNVPLCKIIIDRRFRGTCCLHHQGSISSLMMEAARTSETSVYNYFTRQYIPEDNSELHLSYQVLKKYNVPWSQLHMYVNLCVCMYVCMLACMHVCMYVSLHALQNSIPIYYEHTLLREFNQLGKKAWP
jgi:hypothetical protein